MSANGRDVTKQAIIDVNSIVSGRNYQRRIQEVLKGGTRPTIFERRGAAAHVRAESAKP